MFAIIFAVIIAIFSIIGGYYLSRYLLKYTHGKNYKQIFSEIPSDSKKQKKIIILVPLSISLIFVVLYRIISEQKFDDYIKYGLLSVAVNLIFASIFIFNNKEKFLNELGWNNFITLAYCFTLIIPFTVYFVFISMIISGFQLPYRY